MLVLVYYELTDIVTKAWLLWIHLPTFPEEIKSRPAAGGAAKSGDNKLVVG